MFSLPNRKTLPALLALALLVLAIASCKNFFVDAKLTSLATTADASSVAVNSTDQLHATGTYDDNSTKDLSSSAAWTPSSAAILMVDKNGLATGKGVGTATVTAKVGTLTSNTLSIVVGTLTSITLTASPATTLAPGSAVTFTATGNYSPSGTADLTKTVTWSSSNTNVISSVTAGSATVASNAVSKTTTTITSTDPTTGINATIVITVL